MSLVQLALNKRGSVRIYSYLLPM